jgi:uncharacterized membrane protein
MLLPVLNTKIPILSFHFPVYFLLQLLFSLSGMLVMLVAIHHLPIQNNNDVVHENNKLYWPLFLCILLIILISRFAGWPEYNSFWSVVMALMGGTTYALLLTSFLFKKLITVKKLNHELN